MEALGNRNFYQPTAPTISLNGHLISGSGNAVFGDKVRYIYDFVENYTVNGVSYTANNSNIVDKMLAASRGTIDQVCLRSDFVQPEEWYSISHTVRVFGNVDTFLVVFLMCWNSTRLWNSSPLRRSATFGSTI